MMSVKHRFMGMVFVGFVLFAALSAGCTTVLQKEETPAPPPHFESLAQLDLSAGPVTDQVVGEFTLDETAEVGIFFTLQELNSDYFDLRLVTADGEEITILHGEAMRTDQNGGGLWEERLSPGAYRLLLTAHQSPGRVALYWGQR
jgi:hypothetical protein